MYRFGDSTPFPLNENFIETLAAVVDAAVSLYRAEAVADEAHRRTREARKAAADELRRLEALSALVHGTIGPLAPDGPATRESDAATARIVELSRDVIGRARAEVVRRRDEAIQLAMGSHHHELVRAALAGLFGDHALPGGAWSIEWTALDGGTLVLTLQATKTLAIELGAALPSGDRFAGPLKVAELCPPLADLALGGATERKRTADRFGQLSVLELDLSPRSVRMLIGKPDHGGGLVVARTDGGPAIASWLTAEGELGGRVELDPAQVVALTELCDAAEACRPELLGHRRELRTGSFHGQGLDELEHPAVLAEELLAAVAPLVREMRLRSRVPGELVLKRDLGGDRREELFVARGALVARFAVLPEGQRRAFEAIGLGDEATVEFRARIARGTDAPEAPRAGTGATLAEPATPQPRALSQRQGRRYEITDG